MNDEERFKIISNAYADLLLEYDPDNNQPGNIPNSSVNIINHKYAVVHLPVSDMTPDSVSKYGYSALPTCYGLLSSPGHISTGISRIRNIPDLELRGRGVLVGFVDTGIDYTHPAFKNPDNTSRILSIWDQTIDSGHNPAGYYYGSEYSRDTINMALKSENPMEIVPSTDEVGHGTMLAGITAGTQVKEYGFTGVVPSADLVIVKLKTAKPYLKDFYAIPDATLCYQENDIIFGVKYLTQLAERLQRPIAICLGLGSSQGDHTGNSILSRYLTSIAEKPNIAVIVSAGNEGNTGHHYYGEKLKGSNPDTVELFISHNDTEFSMEFWGLSSGDFWIDIFPPTGEFVTRIPPYLDQALYLNLHDTGIEIDTDPKEVQTGKRFILFRFQNPLAGIWRFLVYPGKEEQPLKYHIWLPINGFLSPGTFFLKSSNETTVTTPGNTVEPICVTTYNYINQSLYYNASLGFTMLNSAKPDLAAPGVNVLCPGINKNFVNATGSSLAAAHVTGVAAMLLEWGIIRGNSTYMDNEIVKKLLIQGAKRSYNLEYPNPEWGYGIIDIFRTFQYILQNKATISELFFCNY